MRWLRSLYNEQHDNTFIGNLNVMKKLRKKMRLVALFLSGLVLFQSCSTYKAPITLEQATRTEKPVKIITVDDESYKYSDIIFEDGKFFGIKDNPGENVKFPIDAEEVKAVMMKKGFPWWAWVLMVSGAIFLILIIVYVADDTAYYGGP